MVWKSEEPLEVPSVNFLSWAFGNVPDNPNKPIFIDANDPSRNLSWTGTKALICRFAAGLDANGVKPGDCVSIMARNDILYFPLWLAAMAVGAVPCGMPTVYTPGEVKGSVPVAGITHMIVGPEFLEHAIDASSSFSREPSSSIFLFDPLDERVAVDTPQGTFKAWKSLLGHGERPWRDFSDPQEAKDTSSMRSFTSGTTGRSKAVNHSHYSLLGHLTHICFIHQHPPDNETRVLHYLGFAHMSGIYVTGCAIRDHDPMHIFSAPPTPALLAQKISEFQITDAMMSPDYITALAKLLPKGSDAIRSLERVMYAGASLPAEARDKFIGLLSPQARIGSAYGLTEAGGVASFRIGRAESYVPGSTGLILPNVEILLLDDDDAEITAPNTRGEVCVRSPGLFTAYFNNPAATAAAFTPSGHFRTGDLAYIDAHTQAWHISGRRKEVFKVDYEHVSPVEIEGELVAHPEIADACVVPVPVAGEFWPRIRAYVVRKGTELDEGAVLGWMEGRLAAHKRITGGVLFVQRVPRNPFGKLERYKVALMAKGVVDPAAVEARS